MGVPTRVRAEPTAWIAPRGATRAQALIGGGLAALVVGLGMLVLRSTLEVRSIPERVMEWVLLFIPTSVFESLLQRFGFDAKRYALDAAVLIMLAGLTGVGYVVLRAGWRVTVIPLVGLAFWLVIMLVIMPVTSAGLFAGDLEEGRRAAVGGYLAIALSYAAVLGVVRLWITRTVETADYVWDFPSKHARAARQAIVRSEVLDRRIALGLIGTTGLAYAATYAVSVLLPRRASAPSILILDPQAPVPSGGLDTPNEHPQAIATPNAGTAAPASASGAAGALPEPPPERQLQRDKDGAVVRSARQPGQLTPPITSNNDFYVVTKNAGGDPMLHPQDWRVLVDGEIGRSFELDYATLRKLPPVELTRTLECISNFVGKPELAPFGAELIGNATWKGVRLSDILQLGGGPNPGVAWLAVLSADEYTAALPMEAALDPGTVLVYAMNGEVLPREHGYPARLLVPNRYGMKNPKWVIGLRPMRREFNDWYGQRNWSKTGIVQTMCRIDAPAPGATLPAGPNTLAGIAFAGSRGIQQVEYSLDGGKTWQPARILDAGPSPDRWVRWQADFNLPPAGSMILGARATDGSGQLQDKDFSLPEPDGGTGWPSIVVQAL